MIGNDIVDLNLAQKQSNWRRKGFLDKVFSRNEQMMITRSSAPDKLVWKFWSMKESAYKAHVRIQKTIQLNPLSFECQILSDKEGLVRNGHQKYYTLSETNNNFVHTRASTDQSYFGDFSNVIGLDQNHDSDHLYEALISIVSAKIRYDPDDLEVVKNNLGIPELFNKGTVTDVLCSLSHHGRFGSFLARI